MRKKKTRQNKLIQLILQRRYVPRDKKELARALHVSVNTIQKDMNKIRDNLTKIALEQSKTKLILRINDRIPDMKNSDLIRLYESFFPKKQHVKVAEETKIVVKMFDCSKERKS